MTREARIFFLTQIAEAFEGNHMNTEAEAIREAIYDTGIIDTLRKERDASIEAIKQTEIIHCGECVHHIDHFFCRIANHYTSEGSDCMSVFEVKRRRDG